MNAKTAVTFEDATDASFDGIKAVELVNGERRVIIVLSDNCVRWTGFAKGIEARIMKVSEKKLRQHSFGWVPVNGRHEFHDCDRDKCIRNAVKWVNQEARY